MRKYNCLMRDHLIEQVDGLRDIMAANYEELRLAFAQLREGDLSRVTADGQPLSRLVAEIVMAPRRDARAAGMLAEGKRVAAPPISRAIDALTEWRGRRAFARAERGDVLTAWENAFTDLFSCANDLYANAGETESPANAEALGRAWAHLGTRIALWPAWAAAVRSATDRGATP